MPTTRSKPLHDQNYFKLGEIFLAFDLPSDSVFASIACYFSDGSAMIFDTPENRFMFLLEYEPTLCNNVLNFRRQAVIKPFL